LPASYFKLKVDITPSVEHAHDLRRAAESIETLTAEDKIKTEALREIASSKHQNYSNNEPGSYGIGVTDGHRFCAEIASKALDSVSTQQKGGSTQECLHKSQTEYRSEIVECDDCGERISDDNNKPEAIEPDKDNKSGAINPDDAQQKREKL